jgi:hypothetical protein
MLTHQQRCIHKPQDASRNGAERLLRIAVRECSCLPGRVETAGMTADDQEIRVAAESSGEPHLLAQFLSSEPDEESRANSRVIATHPKSSS